MKNTYGVYQNARDAAWQALLDYHVTSLPVSVAPIARAAGISIIKNSLAEVLQPGEAGITMRGNESWGIFYDDTMPTGRIRFTIAHELGHIFLGHPLTAGKHARTRTFDTSKPEQERQADIFASRLLAPACILWALNARTPEEIADLCGISMQAAAIRAERMQELYKRNKFLTHPLERQVYQNFKDFIDKY